MNSIKKALYATTVFGIFASNSKITMGMNEIVYFPYPNGCSLSLYEGIKANAEDILKTFKRLKKRSDYDKLCLKIVKFFAQDSVNHDDPFYLKIMNLFHNNEKETTIREISKTYNSELMKIIKKYNYRETNMILYILSEKYGLMSKNFDDESMKSGKAYSKLCKGSRDRLNLDMRYINNNFQKFNSNLNKNYLYEVSLLVEKFVLDIGFPSWKCLEKAISPKSPKKTAGCPIF